MAFNFNSNNAASNNGQQADWKAQAFLNIWARRQDGSRVKIGAIPLKDSRHTDKLLIDRLKEEGGLEALAQALELDFQLAESKTTSIGF